MTTEQETTIVSPPLEIANLIWGRPESEDEEPDHGVSTSLELQAMLSTDWIAGAPGNTDRDGKKRRPTVGSFAEFNTEIVAFTGKGVVYHTPNDPVPSEESLVVRIFYAKDAFDQNTVYDGIERDPEDETKLKDGNDLATNWVEYFWENYVAPTRASKPFEGKRAMKMFESAEKWGVKYFDRLKFNGAPKADQKRVASFAAWAEKRKNEIQAEIDEAKAKADAARDAGEADQADIDALLNDAELDELSEADIADLAEV